MSETANFATDWTFALRCLQVFFGYRYLLAAVLAGGYLYLLLRRRKSRAFILFTGSVILAVVIFNPILQPILIRLSNTSTFYRLFWTVPFPFLGAFFLALLVEKIPEGKKWSRPGKVIAGVLAAVLIVATQPVYSQLQLNFRKPENYYKVPNQLIYACNEIHRDFEAKFGPAVPSDPKTSPGVFFPEGLDVYARQYDASLRVMMSRNKLLRYFGSQVVGEESEERQEGWRTKILNVIYSGDAVSTADLKEGLRYTRTRYLVIPLFYTCHEQLLEAGGEVVAEGNGLVIYYFPMALPKILKDRVDRGEVPGDSRTQAMAAGLPVESDPEDLSEPETEKAMQDKDTAEGSETEAQSAAEKQDTAAYLDLGSAKWEINRYHVTVPDADRTYQFVILNDLHLIADSEEILPEKRPDALARRDELFLDGEGNRSADIWPALAAEVDKMGTDGIIIAGDLLDFCSGAGISLVREALSGMKTPFMYLRADHDVGNWNTGEEKKKIRAAERSLCDNSPVLTMDFPAFTLVGINNSTSQITEKGAQILKPLLSGDHKPVILFTHVPFEPLEDAGLSAASREVWQDRSLLWGENSYYKPNENTDSCMELLFAGGSPVRAVFAGHLHFRYDGVLCGDTMQHVLDANYKGNISLLSVGPEDV